MHDDVKDLYSSLYSLITITNSVTDATRLIRSLTNLALGATVDQALSALKVAEQITPIAADVPLDDLLAAIDFADSIAQYSHIDQDQSSPLSDPTDQTLTDPIPDPTPDPAPDDRPLIPATLSDQADATLANLRRDGYGADVLAAQLEKTAQWIGRRTGSGPLSSPMPNAIAEKILSIDWTLIPKTKVHKRPKLEHSTKKPESEPGLELKLEALESATSQKEDLLP